MADKINDTKYLVIFSPMDGAAYTDVLHFSFIRIPIIKQSSFSVLRINLPPILIEQIKMTLSDNKFPKVNISISSIYGENEKKVMKPIYDRKHVIIGFKPLANMYKAEKQLVPVELVLSNPTLYNMSNSLKYNKIHDTKTGLQIIKDYENFIKTTYGDTFEFIDLHLEENTFIHEQILIKPHPGKSTLMNGQGIYFDHRADIDVPADILLRCRVTAPYSFYFFDEFASVGEVSQKPIRAFFITLYDDSKLKEFPIDKESDILLKTRRIGQQELSDVFKSIDKPNPVITFKTPDGIFKTTKITSSEVEKQMTDSKTTIEGTSGRDGTFIKSHFESSTISQSGDFLNIFCPDSPDEGMKRIEKIKETIKDKLDYFEIFQTTDCRYDWIQFGRKYPMDLSNTSQFSWTPIAITNIFRRVHQKEEFLSHNARYTMLKFKTANTAQSCGGDPRKK